MDLQGQIQRLQRMLLSWDYFSLVDAEESGSSVVQELFDVPNTFDSMDHYTSVFGRLVLEECAAQMVRGVEESELILPHRALCDSASWADADFLVAKLFLPPDDFARYMVNDLVLVCRRNPEEVSNPEEEVYAIAWVQGRDRPAHLVLRLFASDDAQAGRKEALMRITALRNIMLRSSREENTWWVLRLANMATIMREWMAVFNAQYTPLADILLTAQCRKTASRSALDIPKRMHDALRSSFNPSQFQALTAGMTGSPLVLIQGPPGTGKTRTILGLLSVVMHMAEREQLGQAGDDDDGEDLAPSMSRLSQLWLAAAPWLEGATCNPRDQVTPDLDARCGEDCFGLLRRATPRRITTAKKRLAHILVCAPSNSALDEIASRLMQQGLLDAAGQPLSASIVRVGISYHHSVASVSLEHLLQQRLGADPSSFKVAERERVKGLILDEADIICSTLSFSGSGVFQRMTRRFDVVVIDEAAQAVEPSVLVPLLSGAKQVYMVGDPRQLPATVISTRATKHGYTTSLFKRLQMAGYPVQVLDTQYRMHPAISKFPSIMFYDSHLKDAPGVGSETMRPWHKCPAFAPFVVYDVQGKEEIPGGSSSLVNLKEAELLVALLLRLVAMFPAALAGSHIGVVSPYKAQVKELRSRLKTALGENARNVDVNTIDGFQGREKDIILFSTVRSGAGRRKAIGFLADERRINVGLTRARSSLIVVGNTKALMKDDNWGGLVSWARTKKCLYKAATPFRSFVEGMVEGSVTPEEVPALTMEEEAAAPESAAQGQQEKPKRPSKAASAAAAKAAAGKRSKR